MGSAANWKLGSGKLSWGILELSGVIAFFTAEGHRMQMESTPDGAGTGGNFLTMADDTFSDFMNFSTK